MQQTRPVSAGLRAVRTFLQTACGMLAAILLFAFAGILPEVPDWQPALLILTASAAAALIARIMN